MVTERVPVTAVRAGLVTVQDSVSVAPLPAVNVDALEVCPAVIVPPVIDHEYVLPVWAGTLADKPVLPAVTEAGAVMVATGCA
jgi:hypothetical protein